MTFPVDSPTWAHRRAALRPPETYTTVGDWFSDYHGFVPVTMAHALSQVIEREHIPFAEAYARLVARGSIIEIDDA